MQDAGGVDTLKTEATSTDLPAALLRLRLHPRLQPLRRPSRIRLRRPSGCALRHTTPGAQLTRPPRRPPTQRTSRRPGGRARHRFSALRGRGAEACAAASPKRAQAANSLQTSHSRRSRVPCDEHQRACGSPPSTARRKGSRWRSSRASREARRSSSSPVRSCSSACFFTWQNVEVDYGRAGVATLPLDGFDAWGLLLALLVLSTLTLVVLPNLTRRRDVRATSRGRR